MWPFSKQIKTLEELEDEVIKQTLISSAYGNYIAMDGCGKLEADIKIALAKKNIERIKDKR